MHLRSFVRRQAEIEAAGIREIVVFHAPAEELRRHAVDLPFAVVADPDKRLHDLLGAESSLRSLFGLPADFLFASDGRLLACKYGEHVYDQWSVDDVLALVRPFGRHALARRAG